MNRAPTMSDVARVAGVSKNTVSLALRNDTRLPMATRKRLQRIAARLGYRKDPVVAQLMVQLRAGRRAENRPVLALVNAHRDPRAFRTHPTIPAYIEGCRKRAHELGYGLDEFWLHEPGMQGERLARIFRARSIPGAVLVGLMEENRLPETMKAVWAQFPCVVTGVRTRDPALSFCAADHHMLAYRAVQECRARGYRRPALVLDQVIENLVDRRFSAGYHAALAEFPRGCRPRPFFRIRDADRDREVFVRWLRRERPDAVLTLYNRVRDWVEAAGLRVPGEVGMVQMEWRRRDPGWAGMDQHNDVVGEAAVEMLVGMIQHGESGPPDFPRATLIGSSWKEGGSLPVRVAALAGW